MIARNASGQIPFNKRSTSNQTAALKNNRDFKRFFFANKALELCLATSQDWKTTQDFNSMTWVGLELQYKEFEFSWSLMFLVIEVGFELTRGMNYRVNAHSVAAKRIVLQVEVFNPYDMQRWTKHPWNDTQYQEELFWRKFEWGIWFYRWRNCLWDQKSGRSTFGRYEWSIRTKSGRYISVKTPRGSKGVRNRVISNDKR